MRLNVPAGVQAVQSYLERARVFAREVTVYPVSCEALADGRSDRQWLDGVLAGGARIVQLRDKESPDHVLHEKARYFRSKTREAGALFLVNDRVDIALRAGADGIHVGQNDMDPVEVRAQLPDLIIGLSCNTLDQVSALGRQVREKRSPVTYYNIGPLFATQTKAGLTEFLGLGAIAEFSSRCALPFTVMGGIKFHHIGPLCALGARRIAVVTALSRAEDIGAETARWHREIAARSGPAVVMADVSEPAPPRA